MIAILKKSILLLLTLTFISQCTLLAQHDTIKANTLLEKALDLYDDGDYIPARKPFKKALKLREKHYPENHVKIEDLYYWLGRNEQGLRDNEKSLDYFQKGLEIAIKRTGPNSLVVGDFYMDIANTLDQQYRVDEAKEYYQKTLVIYENEFGKESSDVGNVLMNIGYGQRKMGNYRDAGEYYKKAFDLFKKSSEPTSKDFYRIYINQCNLLIDLGNYDRALDFAEKALKIKLIHYDTLHPSVYKYYGNIGRIYRAKGMPEKALPYFEKALKIAEVSRGKKHPETAGQLGYLADAYADLGQLDKALKLQKKSVKIQEKGLPPTHPYLVSGYGEIGRTYENKKDFDQALDFYQHTIQQYQKADHVPKHFIASILRRIARVHSKKDDLPKALLTIQQGIQYIAPNFEFEENDFYKNPNLDLIQAEAEFLDLLKYKARFLQAKFKKEKTQPDLEQALKTSELAIELIEKIRRSYQSESAKQFLNSETTPIYEQAVEQAFDLYLLTKDRDYLLKAFEISEKSKASILQQNINEQYALKISNIPLDKIESLQALHQEIAVLEESFLSKNNLQEQKQLESNLFDLKLNYEQSIISLEESYPRYAQLKYASKNLSPKNIQQNLLDEKTILVEYFHTEYHVFIFTFSKNEFKGFKMPITFDLEESVLSLRKNDVQRMISKKGTDQKYISTLHKLHALLLNPIKQEVENVQNLILIPHGILQLLSFETLAPNSGSPDFRNLDYLLKKYSIHYAWSAGLWLEEVVENSSHSIGFSGFAPVFKSNNNKQITASDLPTLRATETELTHSVPEIENAVSYFPGKTFINTAASESEFLQWAPKSRIIHLATHGQANDRHPLESGLVFSEKGDSLEDGFLNTLEIYNLNLSADLAVMSACNTGYGQLAEGEGIMSLGRAFMYAGCKSVISSLWLANDESTSSIMQGFYKYSSDGFSKDQALRNAKLDYLNQSDPLTAHPYFWANLVAVGDMTSLQSNEKTFPWWIALMLSGLLFLVFIFKK